MTTPHIEADPKDIAPLVLLPGDPLRAKFIAQNYLDDVRLVNEVRICIFSVNYFPDRDL